MSRDAPSVNTGRCQAKQVTVAYPRYAPQPRLDAFRPSFVMGDVVDSVDYTCYAPLPSVIPACTVTGKVI